MGFPGEVGEGWTVAARWKEFNTPAIGGEPGSIGQLTRDVVYAEAVW
jgi:hypothetical protein